MLYLLKMRSKILLLVILAIALFLRVYDLAEESIWLDEGISLRLAQAQPIPIIVERAFNNHPPFYFVLLHLWAKIFSDTIFSARFLSLIFGMLVVCFMFVLGRRIFTERVGILSSLFVALSLFHIHYSQEIRMYSLVAFLALLSMYFFIRLFDEKRVLSSAGYCLSSILFLYTHYSSLLILIVQNLFFVILLLLNRRPRDGELDLGRWIKLQIIIAAAYLPWIWIALLRFKKIQTLELWVPKPSIFSLVGTLRDYAGSGMHLLISLGIFILLVTYLIKYRNKVALPGNRRRLLAPLWFLTPLVILFVVSQFSASLYVTKYTIAASVAFYLILAWGIEQIWSKRTKLIVLGLIVVLFAPGIWKYYNRTNKIPWKDVGSDIEERAQSGDLLVINDPVCNREAFRYYFRRQDVLVRILQPTDKKVHIAVLSKGNTIQTLLDITKDHKRVWILLVHTLDKDLLIKKRFLKSHRLLYHKIYESRSYITDKLNNFVEVFLLEKR